MKPFDRSRELVVRTAYTLSQPKVATAVNKVYKRDSGLPRSPVDRSGVS